MTIKSISRITKRITSQLAIVTGVARSSSAVMISILTNQTPVFTISTRRVVELQADVTMANAVELASARVTKNGPAGSFRSIRRLLRLHRRLPRPVLQAAQARSESEDWREVRRRSVSCRLGRARLRPP